MLAIKKVLLQPVFYLASLLCLTACNGPIGNGPTTIGASSPGVISVVAAENFYGDIVKQLGGSHVSVVSILSDPTIDPHEYESSVQDAAAITNAKLVIRNGDGYDTWIDKLLSASPNASRVVLTGADIADHRLRDNPHIWYGIDNIQTIAEAITTTLKRLDNGDAATFEGNLTRFKQSLAPIQQKMSDLKAKYVGTPVGLTETIYLYQSNPIGLRVRTPLEFEKAISEGNDPPADTVATSEDQIKKHQVKVLIYNVQTVTPVTTNLQNDAKKENIPIVAVTETMPQGKTYQTWMLDQLNVLSQALQSAT